MNKFYTALMTVAALAIAMPVTALGECVDGVDGISDPEVTTCTYDRETGAQDGVCSIYVDEDQCPGYLYSIWMYAETNGIFGLQRSDDGPGRNCDDDGVHDPCPGNDPDFLIF